MTYEVTLDGVDVSELISLEQFVKDETRITKLYDEYSDVNKKKRIAAQPELVRAKMAIAYGRNDDAEAVKRLQERFGSSSEFLTWVENHPTVVELVLEINCSMEKAMNLLQGVIDVDERFKDILKPGEGGKRFTKGTEHFGWVPAVTNSSSRSSRADDINSLLG